jgi:hypothetical protein
MTIDLSHFTGTEKWFRHSLVSSVTYTEGVQYLAEQAGAYWLVDKIATNQLVAEIRAQPFQSWRLTVNPDASATLEAEDGNGNVLYSEFIHFTDFPMPDMTLWCVDRVILLPSEY